MDRDNWDSKVSRRRRGALVAGVVMLGSSGALAAGPLPGEPIAMESLVRPVQADGDEARAATEAADRTPFEELNAALAAARAKLEELTSAAEIAAITSELRAELAAAKENNRRLADELEQARSALDTARTQLDAADAELEERARALRERNAREDALIETAERSAEEVARLREQLAAGEEKLAQVERKREETRARMVELKEALSGALAEAAQLRRRLSNTEAALADAERQRDAARAASAKLQSENDRLQRSLAAARARADRLGAERAQMEDRLARLQKAADTAAEAARANLLAMEDKIVSLNSALADVRGRKTGPEATGDAPPRDGDDEHTRDAPPEVRAVRTPGATFRMPPPATPAAAREDDAGRDNGDGIEARSDPRAPEASRPDERRALARATDALPFEERMQVQALLADLKAEPDDRGLRLTVPGGILFESNSDRVQATAHETLAKVAEVLDLYDGHEVLITGHTDAMGDAAYNKTLSQRRAELVKAFFVDNFDIDDSRLSTRGLGEKQPIASNATHAGRKANRRVEVLILD